MGGTLCIFVRHGGVGNHGVRDAEPSYTLIPETQLRPPLRMEETAEAAVLRQFPEIFETMAENALKSSFRL